jgi:hypothetical protein
MLEKRMEDNALVSWDAKCAVLEDAFCKLTIQRDETATGISYKSVIPGIARELMLMAPISRPKAASARAIRSLTSSTGRTIKVLDNLSQSALDTLNYPPDDLRELTKKLRMLHAAAETRVSQRPDGQPKKVQPGKIAQVVAQHYFALTGERPTVRVKDGEKAYGPFLELLSTIFYILDVDASAESQTRAVIKDWKDVVAKFPRPKKFKQQK